MGAQKNTSNRFNSLRKRRYRFFVPGHGSFRYMTLMNNIWVVCVRTRTTTLWHMSFSLCVVEIRLLWLCEAILRGCGFCAGTSSGYPWESHSKVVPSSCPIGEIFVLPSGYNRLDNKLFLYTCNPLFGRTCAIFRISLNTQCTRFERLCLE